MIGDLIFLFPTVLQAAGLAAAPILIHLILKTKARRIVFPALQFVKKTHQANINRLRLKHLILLALRMMVIVMVAALLARAEIPSWQAVAERNVPTAAVIVIDDSGSMTYRRQGQPLIGWARQQAADALKAMIPGSRVAVIGASGRGDDTMLDPSQCALSLEQWTATAGRQSLAAAIARATRLVQQCDLRRKEVYVITDMTACAWRDGSGVSGSAEGASPAVQYNIINVGGEDLNVALGDVRLSATAVPAGVPVKIDTTVSSANISQEVTVAVELNGQAVWQQSLKVPSGGSTSVAATITPATAGLLHGRVLLKNTDPMELDNVRYFTLAVGAPSKMLIVVGPTNIGRTGFIMGAAVCPPSDGGQEGIARTTISADALDANALVGVRIVMLADAVALSDKQWKMLLPMVEAGGAVWVIAGPAMGAESYTTEAAQRLMPASLGAAQELAAPLAWAPKDLSHPMLAPFGNGQNPPLSDVTCRRRFAIASLASDAASVMDYADGVPALLSRRVGEGTVVLWNFSPLRTLSNLAALPQLPILAARTAQVLSVEPGAPASYPWGQAIMLPIPQALGAATITVKGPTDSAERPVLPDARQRAVNLLASDLGRWDVRMTEGSRHVERGFSVNAEAAESDLTPAEPKRVCGLFPPDCSAVTASVSELIESRRMIQQPLDLSVPLLLALLALIVGESFFANRFYKQTVVAGVVAPSHEASPPPTETAP